VSEASTQHEPDELRFLMICGSMPMLTDASRWPDSLSFTLSARIGCPGDYVIERAFVEAVGSRVQA
jgi:hypothetical protein